AGRNDGVWCERHQFGRIFTSFLGVEFRPPSFDPYIASSDPARLREPLKERPDPGLKFRIVRGCRQQHADAPHPLGLLRTRRERPRRRAAKQCDELTTAAHSITSSARNRIDVGTSRPIALAVLTLTVSSTCSH